MNDIIEKEKRKEISDTGRWLGDNAKKDPHYKAQILRDQQYIKNITSAIVSAKHYICICTFLAQWTPRPRGKLLSSFWQTLIEQAKSGIRIMVIMNRSTKLYKVSVENHHTAKKLQEHGIHIRHPKKNRCMHVKMLLIDQTVIFMGSHNLSVGSNSNNIETTIQTANPNIISAGTKIFQDIWLSSSDWK